MQILLLCLCHQNQKFSWHQSIMQMEVGKDDRAAGTHSPQADTDTKLYLSASFEMKFNL